LRGRENYSREDDNHLSRILCVAGGKLQGLEAVYLARKAKYKTILVDRDDGAPATPLVDEFYKLDITKEKEELRRVLRRADAVLPALEDLETLSHLEKTCRVLGIPYMQDNKAFKVTSNKLLLTELFQKLKLPYPKAWPQTDFPVVVKPAHKSGGMGVHRVDSQDGLSQAVKSVLKVDSEYLIQEYVRGLPLSLELFRVNGISHLLQVTVLEFDNDYGCKRVIAPYSISHNIEDSIFTMGEKIAEGLDLSGLTDLQVIHVFNDVRVIEANARLPSQTPTVVYNSTDLNILELTYEASVGSLPLEICVKPKRAVIYQHIKVSGNSLNVVGEHILSKAKGLRVENNFFGVDEAITNIPEGGTIEGCVATLIVRDRTLQNAKKKIDEALRRVMTEYQVKEFTDSSPEGLGTFYDKIDA